MKPNMLAGQLTLWIPLYILYKKCKKSMLVASLLFTIVVTGCYQHYYRTHTKSSTDTEVLQRLQSSNKYFIVHFPDRTVGLQNVSINQNNIEGDEVLLPTEHSSELNPKTSGINAMKKRDRDSVLVEVHLYTSNTGLQKGKISMPVSDINRLDVYEYDRNATRFNHTLSTAGVVITSAFVISLVTLAIACNCPQVYVEDNGIARFNGGMYSGAIYSSLERTDYMPLPIVRTSENKLKLTVKNVPEEEQFINNMQLLQVSHGLAEKVLVDRHGKAIIYKNPVAPSSIDIGNAKAVPGSLDAKDGEAYLFNNTMGKHNSEIILKFKRDKNTGKAKLIINAKNSAWSGYVFKEFSSLFGESAEAWRKKQEKTNPEKLEEWQKKQSLPIMVYVKNEDAWEFVDYFPATGNTASRDMIMQLDLKKNDADFIEIKLETVFRFWELNYAALDFSESPRPTVKLIPPVLAQTTKGSDQRNTLLKKDGLYSHLTDDDAIDLEFDLARSMSGGDEVSYFLVSSGYYHNQVKYTGKANIPELLKLKNEGGFHDFSRRKYDHANGELAKYSVTKSLDK